MEDGRVSDIWRMCVVSHGYGGLGGGRDGGDGWCACGTKARGWSHVGICWSNCRLRCDTLKTSLGHIAVQVRSSGLDRIGIGRSSWKGLITGRHDKAPIHCPCRQLAALHGPWCSTDTIVVDLAHACTVLTEGQHSRCSPAVR